jgi:hypothetical protein
VSKKEQSSKPAPESSGKGVSGAHLGRRYCPETHQWVEDAEPVSVAVPQPAPDGAKE